MNVDNKKLYSENVSCHSHQHILFSHRLSTNLKTETKENINEFVLLYGYKNLVVTLREEYRLRMFVNRVLSKLF
jgi:hypothetical protein